MPRRTGQSGSSALSGDTGTSPASALPAALASLLDTLAQSPGPQARQQVLDLLLALRHPEASDAALARQAQALALALLDAPTLKARADALRLRLAAADGPQHLGLAQALVLALRNIRDFEGLAQLAEAVCRIDPACATTRRLQGQALIEIGQVTVAIDLLQALQRRLPRQHPEQAEAQGLLGRAHKQLYVDAADRASVPARRALAAAVAAYRGPYERSPQAHAWHGVNLLALVYRAGRDGVPDLAPGLDMAALAAELHAALTQADTAAPDPWHLATLAEVALGRSLASGDLAPVEQALAAYLRAPTVTAFQVASTLRQFEQVWRLGDLAPGGPGHALADAATCQRAQALLDILRARLLSLPGGGVALAIAAPSTARTDDATAPAPAPDPAVPSRGQLEAVLGLEGPKTYAWWRAGVDAARSVAVIRQRLGKRLGTGFLVRAGDFGFAPADEPLLLTNYHVVNPSAEVRNSITPDQAEVIFEAADPARVHTVAKLLWCSPVKEHDACLLRLDAPPQGVPPLPLRTDLPALTVPDGQPPPRVYIIGHPLGGELSFSFQDNELVDHEGPDAGKPQIPGVIRVHYRAPTQGGNSGSPVFDATAWQVLALHHMGSGARRMYRLNGKPDAGDYLANEGLAMRSLVAAARAHAAAQGGR